MKFLTIFTILFMSSALVFADADFGDAPDSTAAAGGTAGFPTLSGNRGPYHTMGSSSTYWIGRLGTGPLNSTTMEAEALVTDLDYDDGQPYLGVVIMGIPASAWVTVPITTSPDHDPGKGIYLNVAIDVNNDLDFDDIGDINWVVRNQIVNMPADTTLGFVYGPFGFGSDLLLFPVWLRATVTDVPVEEPWNGEGPTGGFTYGETEDWRYTFNPGDDDDDDAGDPKKNKCARVKMPRIVYVKCDQVKTFKVTIQNCGGIPLSMPTMTFTFGFGTPLPGAPALAPPPGVPALLNPGKSITYSFQITGWPCDGECNGNHWAWYKAKLSYDPPTAEGDMYYEQEFDLFVASDYDPYRVENGRWDLYLGAEPKDDVEDLGPWETKIGESIEKQLIAFTGRFPWGDRWIMGQPVLTPESLPD